MTRIMWAAVSALTLALVIAAALVDDSADWAAAPIATLVVFVLVVAAFTCLAEMRRHTRRQAYRRHPSHWLPR